MARYGLCVDLGRCIGCYGCVVGCKNWHGVPAGETGRISLKDFFTGMYPQVSRWLFPVMCMHCEHPPCVSVCRFNACHQREDGIVVIDPKRCVGCELCTFACPFGLRIFRHNQGVADGCDFCLERISAGALPYCVASCPTDALVFGDLDDPESAVSKRIRATGAKPPKDRFGIGPKVFYTHSENSLNAMDRAFNPPRKT